MTGHDASHFYYSIYCSITLLYYTVMLFAAYWTHAPEEST